MWAPHAAKMDTLGYAATFTFFTLFGEPVGNRDYEAIMPTCEHAVTFYFVSALGTPKTARCITSIGYAAIPFSPKTVGVMQPPFVSVTGSGPLETAPAMCQSAHM